MFRCKLVCKRSKLGLYTGKQSDELLHEAWVLKDNTVQKLMRFERKILRKIYGPTKLIDRTWRIKTNGEFDNLIEHKNIIHFISPKLEMVRSCRENARG
jgi:hypothetical protein